MRMSVYGNIYYGMVIEGFPYNEEHDCPGHIDPETGDMRELSLKDDDFRLFELGSYGTDRFLLGYEMADAYWGEAIEINPDMFKTMALPERRENIRLMAEELGVTFEEPKFYLTSFCDY